jgi:hypothetical protein
MVLVELVSAARLSTALMTPAALDGYRVRDMLDGGMGSIRFVVGTENRKHGSFSVAQRIYRDCDGVPVLFTLNLDDHDQPWEIDAWKVDCSPLKQPPSSVTDLLPSVALPLAKRP